MKKGHKRLLTIIAAVLILVIIVLTIAGFLVNKSINDFYFKKDGKDIVYVTKEITQCDEPWDKWEPEEKIRFTTKESRIEYYLEHEKNIDVLSVSSVILRNNTGVCEACSCPAGVEIRVSIYKDNLDSLKALGFE